MTTDLIAFLKEHEVTGKSLLDIGGGIGAIQHELVAAGAARVTSVDASSGYLAISRKEAESRGYADRASYHYGDFVDLADSVDDADIVTLDKVLCCYDKVDDLVKKSKGILVFPSVFKAGFVFGGEYGEGALRIKGHTVDYYNTIAASFGFQLGAKVKTVILVFMEQGALDKFRDSEGWEAGVDGSIAIITLGAGDSIDTSNIQDPILGFVFGQKGLMYNLTLEGSKFTKIHPDK
ncbi:MAG: methyltransferase domain-containing protein [Nitrospinae bacterium]|nr:methyltransferase domain-containing protein [Nitrospinota bacterium]